MEPRTRSFHRNAEKALADRQLQTALGRATERFVENRAAAIAQFPAFEATRREASRLKSEALDHLDRHLERFLAEAEARGTSIHVASDAAQARRIAAGIAREEGVTLAVKSKSMVAEEVDLNGALEAAGVEVVETDLGEYIIQLAGEPPSHIIAPAIHKTREEVSELFEKKLGEPYTEEIPDLTRIARRRLREKFLSAQMGISGANFLCADTGSVVLVTNEGNGRMGTVLPRVHLVIAGIEKIVPRLEDVPVFLRLLPRSATGQRASSYLSVLTGPKRPGDAEGPEKLHILLVDNGRSGILAGKYREILKCIRCGACINACPVFQSIGGHAYGWVYPGPVGSVLTPLLLGLPGSSLLPNASTLCGACEEVCPVEIPLAKMLVELRADEREQGLKAPSELSGVKAYAGVMGRAGLFEALQRMFGALSGIFSRDGRISRLPPPFSGWTDRRDFPAPAPQPFRRLWKKARGIRPWNR